jgi:hypothetical protein
LLAPYTDRQGISTETDEKITSYTYTGENSRTQYENILGDTVTKGDN